MASNKNALIRYHTLDKCFRNRTKDWTLEDLMDACSDALYEYEGKYDLVSKRTVQLDIQTMRSEKLGYNAPIEVFQRKFYRYSDSNYSIKNIPVNENDLKVMNDAVQLLKQFKDFSVFQEMNGVLQKLEDSISSVKQKSVIHLDKNERLKGLEFIDILYQSIINRKVICIEYQSFNSRNSITYTVSPQLLKEFNNRWFLVCWCENKMLNLALDRIVTIESSKENYIDKNIDGDSYFEKVIGVTVSNATPQTVIFKVDRTNSPYVITKPFHHSQKTVEKLQDGSHIFEIQVQHNYELERLILGFGKSMTVLAPKELKRSIKRNLKNAMGNYEI
ncbi:MAG: WYL domain-containing protein [Chryseobacterium sp. 39-10]|nr:WYL domain-containing protein [Chryseobacterium sp.]OJV49090.1 MAG: WYL domain-containing protein [Chryseobacterium sp. 39-10]